LKNIKCIVETNTTADFEVIIWVRYDTQTKMLHSIVIYNFMIKTLKLRVSILKNYPQRENNKQIFLMVKLHIAVP
jgi:hypothetical protein